MTYKHEHIEVEYNGTLYCIACMVSELDWLRDWVQEAVDYGVNYDLTEEAWELFGIRKQETSAV